MCTHCWNEQIIHKENHYKYQCMKQVIERTCFFCGKKETEVVLVKDPPRRKDEDFRWNHM